MPTFIMKGIMVVMLLMVILGCFTIPTQARNVVHFCTCWQRTCKQGPAEAICYCYQFTSTCYPSKEECMKQSCPPSAFAPISMNDVIDHKE
ncbi:hypothetical protein BS78_03G168400 [Paspalum vaginatum]|nr:hypothetical protein BS78_03G168400 [Paspalum vaginatum]